MPEQSAGQKRFWKYKLFGASDYYIMFWKAKRNYFPIEINDWGSAANCSITVYFTLVKVIPRDGSGNVSDPGASFLMGGDFYYLAEGNLHLDPHDFNSTQAKQVANFSLTSRSMSFGINKKTGKTAAAPEKTTIARGGADLLRAYCFGAATGGTDGSVSGVTFAVKAVFDEGNITCDGFTASPELSYGPLKLAFEAAFKINNDDMFSTEISFTYTPSRKSKNWSPPAPTPRARPTHTVVAGDTLSSIARGLGITLRQLMQLNPALANPDNLTIGQKINIPK
jgi:LysM repeat protein